MNVHPDIPRFATPKWNTRIKEAREAYEKLSEKFDAYRKRVQESDKDDKETNS